MPGLHLRLPGTGGPQKYRHQRPRRPAHLPKRLEPGPERPGPPDLSIFLYVGIGLAILLAVLAAPYIVSYLLQAAGF